MHDKINRMEFWIAWVIVGLALVGISVFRILPALMLKTCGAAFPVRDRVVGKKEGAFGEELTCEPAVSVRPYISSYRLARDAKGVFFEGELQARRAFLSYEIAAYSASGELLDVLRVKEKFVEEKTHVSRLPKRTDYVSLRMLCVDDSPMPRERRAFGKRLGIWLGVLCLAMAATVDLFLWVGLTFYLRLSDNFTGELDLSADVWAAALILTGLFVAILTGAWAAARFFRMQKREDGSPKLKDKLIGLIERKQKQEEQESEEAEEDEEIVEIEQMREEIQGQMQEQLQEDEEIEQMQEQMQEQREEADG